MPLPNINNLPGPLGFHDFKQVAAHQCIKIGVDCHASDGTRHKLHHFGLRATLLRSARK
jgi:hypothetical protein